jgi:ABC-type multidrug transport system fused ATPase/permease subunit
VSATTHLLQENMLFTGTVAENIAYGIERVLDGAEQALAGEM